MKRPISFAIFVVPVLFCLARPAAANPITTLFSTGVGIAEGQIDPHYVLLSAPTCPASDCSAYAMVTDGFPIPPYMPNTATSKWIEPLGGTVDNHPAGTYVYRTTFSLQGLIPSTALITGMWSSDNAGVDILLNGVSLGLVSAYEQFRVFAPFSIDHGFVLDENTLDFVIDNAVCPTCRNNPTAIRVELAGTALPNPEPASILLLGSGLAAITLARRRARKH